jgi:hypothetical protein
MSLDLSDLTVESTDTPEQVRATLAPDTTDTPVDVAAPEETPADDVAEPESEPDPASEAGKALSKKRGVMHARVNQLRREKGDVERERDAAKAERDALKARLAALEQPKAPEPQKSAETPQSDAEPTYEAFVKAHPDHADPYQGYIRELARWDLKQELAKERTASAASDAQRAQQVALADFGQRGTKAHADFEAKLTELVDAGVQFSPVLTLALLEDPDGPELAYALANDVAEATRLAGMTNERALGKELGKLSTKLEVAKHGPSSSEKPQSTAKPPIKPLGSSPVTGDDTDVPDDLSVDEYIVRMNALERRRRHA